MEWILNNWLGILSVILGILGLVLIKQYTSKNSHRAKISRNINSGNGSQYNAGRDINLNDTDKK